MLNSYYTYLHRRQSDNAVFYIGKGKGVRAHTRHNRSDRWRKCVAKHGFIVEIVAHWPAEREALDHEVFLIKTFREMGANLCNHTDGGEGVSGLKHSEESKMRMAAAKIGTKQSAESVQARRSKILGKPVSPAVRAMRQEMAKDPVIRAKISASMKAHVRSEEHERKLQAIFQTEAFRSKVSASAPRTKSPEHAAKMHKPVRCTTNGMEFDSLKSALKWLHVLGHTKAKSGRISMVLTGRSRQTYGYHWEYAEKSFA